MDKTKSKVVRNPKKDSLPPAPVQGIEGQCCIDITDTIIKYGVKTVVETGVYYGRSTNTILSALPDDGLLVSIENNPFNIKTLLVEPKYFHKWLFIYGSSENVLPTVFKLLPKIDMFWHDSLHTYDHMMFEYELAAKHCTYIGSHDINHPGAKNVWQEFVEEYSVEELIHRSKWAIGKVAGWCR